MLKVMTIVGTRPEVIRLSRTIAALDTHCEHILVHTGQNYDYELNQIFFDELDIRAPDIFLEISQMGVADTIGEIISKVDVVLDTENPDAVLILGDTNSSLAAITAKRRKIPIFHMEAGNRSFDQRVPEEINRRIVDHISDINLPYTSIAREYLLREGLPPDQIIKTGSPMYEVLSHYNPKIEKSKILERLNLEAGKYFVISSHREENISYDLQFSKLLNLLNCLAEEFSYPVIVSTHPRTQKRLQEAKVSFDPLVRFMKPLGFPDYIKLQMQAKCVLSDSGTITEESSLLKFPALNIREAHERPEGMEEASVMMVGLDWNRILLALKLLDSKKISSQQFGTVSDYEIENVSIKVVKIIFSYVDYINRNVWKKAEIENNEQ